MDIDFFIKLGTSAEEEGSVFLYVNRTLINGIPEKWDPEP